MVKRSEAALIYVRVSTDEQARSGLGLEDQEERCRAYCQLRGLEVAEVIADPGVSGGTPLGSRGGGGRVLALTGGRRPKVRHVVSLKLDRAFRSAADCLAVTADWDRRGVVYHVVDLGGASLDLSSPMGRMFLTMAAGFAELERGLIAERTRAAAQRTRARGHAWGGQAPYGFRLGADGKTLEPDPQEQGVVARVRQARDEGATLREIVALLDREEVVGRTGQPLQLTQVARIARRDR